MDIDAHAGPARGPAHGIAWMGHGEGDEHHNCASQGDSHGDSGVWHVTPGTPPHHDASISARLVSYVRPHGEGGVALFAVFVGLALFALGMLLPRRLLRK
jgi:hypothetical protein